MPAFLQGGDAQKSTGTFCFMSLHGWTQKARKTASVGGDVRELKPSYKAGGCKICGHFGTQRAHSCSND